jgi:hypothetical protein
MSIPFTAQALFTATRTQAIALYNFKECLALLNKLQHLDSLVLQSASYQYIIQVLEERIKRLAQNKPAFLPSSNAGQPARFTK